jgi:hypothetical protein
MSAAILATALLRLALGSDLAFGHEASIRAESRVQQAMPGNGSTLTSEALELQPGLGLSAAGRLTTLTVTYSPRFTLQSGNGGRRETWLHLGSMTATWRPAVTWDLRSSVQGFRGIADLFRFLAIQAPGSEAPPLVQAAPVVASIPFQRYEGTVEANGRLTPRLLLRANLGATREGGVGVAALRALPLQQVERLASGLDWRVSRTDMLGVTLAATLAHYFDMPPPPGAAPGGPGLASWSTWSGRLAGEWRHALGRNTSTQASAGLAMVGSDRSVHGRPEILPTAEAAITTEPRLRNVRLQGGASLGLAPQEDRLTGTMVERADLRAWIGWLPTPRWSVRGAVSGGVVVSGQSRRDTFGTGDVRVGWAAAGFLDLALGLRGSVQEQPRLATPRYLQWSAFLDLTAAHRRQAERLQPQREAADPTVRP